MASEPLSQFLPHFIRRSSKIPSAYEFHGNNSLSKELAPNLHAVEGEAVGGSGLRRSLPRGGQLASQRSQRSQLATLPPHRAGRGLGGLSGCAAWVSKSVGNEAVSVLLLTKQHIRESS